MQGASITVPFTYTGSLSSFTVQLSNSSGSFSSPVNIGTGTGSSGSGSITATLPSGTAAGTGYRIRVISTSPAITGTDNGTDLSVNVRPTSLISGNATICSGNSTTVSIALTGTQPWSLTYTNGTPVTVNNITTSPYTFITGTAGTYTVSALSDANCTSIAGDMTGNATITVIAAPTANAGSNASICFNGTYTASGASATNYASLSWSTSGTGVFNNNTLLSPTYTPSNADILAGSITLTLTVTGNSPCSIAVSNLTLTISADTWTAANSSNWNDAGNWSCGASPTALSNVIIPNGITPYPSLTANASVNNLDLEGAATLTIKNNTLTINGAFCRRRYCYWYINRFIEI